MTLPIVKEPDPSLRRKAKPVKEITAEIRRFIADMIETMHAAEGVGLAANQIGSRWNLLVASADGIRGQEIVLMNASFLSRKGWVSAPEGCLSLPGISASVTRFAEVVVRGMDRKGKPQTIEAKGLLARIFQHEIDHLEGHLYVDRLAAWERRRLLEQYRGG